MFGQNRGNTKINFYQNDKLGKYIIFQADNISIPEYSIGDPLRKNLIVG